MGQTRPEEPRGEGGTGAPRPLVRGARMALVLLLLINLFNYIDRYVLASTEPEIRKALLLSADPDDPNVKSKMGSLSTAFMVSYMITAPLFGFLAERMSRWLLIAAGVAVWSLASGASGWAATFGVMWATRCFVGVGEGAYGPVAPTLISDYYPLARRGQVLAWFYMAIPVGSALGYALGELVAELDPEGQSWRWAFYIVVLPGLLLALWSLLVREPQRGEADRLSAPARRARLGEYLILLRTPSYVLNTLGMTAMTFAIGAISFWMPGYLKDNHVEAFCGLPPRTVFAAITVITGVTATLAGGMLGDALRSRFAGSYFLVSGVGLCISFPCVLGFAMVPFPWAWLFVFLAEFFLFFNTGPSNTILANVAHPSMRATGFALNILVIHLLGDAISPYLIGAVADRFAGKLEPGFVVVSAFLLLGGAFWLWGVRYLQRDTLAAPHRLDAPHAPRH